MKASRGNIIKLISANINSWNRHGEYILSNWKADILALQETRIGDMKKAGREIACRKKGYTPSFGKGQRNQYLQKKAAPTAVQGGVAVVAKDKTCPGMIAAGANSHAARALYEQGRYKRTAIPIKGGKEEKEEYALHILVAHNLPQSGEAATILKERNNVRMMEDAAGQGNQPVILCLGTNQSRGSTVVEEAIRTGRYVDVAERSAGPEGPEPTFCQDDEMLIKGKKVKWDKFTRGPGKTRPDRILVNRVAWELIRSFRLVRESRIPGHIPLEITIDCEAINETEMILKHPKRIEVEN